MSFYSELSREPETWQSKTNSITRLPWLKTTALNTKTGYYSAERIPRAVFDSVYDGMGFGKHGNGDQEMEDGRLFTFAQKAEDEAVRLGKHGLGINPWVLAVGQPSVEISNKFNINNSQTWNIPDAMKQLPPTKILATIEHMMTAQDEEVWKELAPVKELPLDSSFSFHWTIVTHKPAIAREVPQFGLPTMVSASATQGASELGLFAIGCEIGLGFLVTELGTAHFFAILRQMASGILAAGQLSVAIQLAKAPQEYVQSRSMDPYFTKRTIDEEYDAKAMAFGILQNRNYNTFIKLDDSMNAQLKANFADPGNYSWLLTPECVQHLLHENKEGVTFNMAGTDAQKRLEQSILSKVTLYGRDAYVMGPFRMPENQLFQVFASPIEIGEYIDFFDETPFNMPYSPQSRDRRIFTMDGWKEVTFAQALQWCVLWKSDNTGFHAPPPTDDANYWNGNNLKENGKFAIFPYVAANPGNDRTIRPPATIGDLPLTDEFKIAAVHSLFDGMRPPINRKKLATLESAALAVNEWPCEQESGMKVVEGAACNPANAIASIQARIQTHMTVYHPGGTNVGNLATNASDAAGARGDPPLPLSDTEKRAWWLYSVTPFTRANMLKLHNSGIRVPIGIIAAQAHQRYYGHNAYKLKPGEVVIRVRKEGQAVITDTPDTHVHHVSCKYPMGCATIKPKNIVASECVYITQYHGGCDIKPIFPDDNNYRPGEFVIGENNEGSIIYFGVPQTLKIADVPRNFNFTGGLWSNGIGKANANTSDYKANLIPGCAYYAKAFKFETAQLGNPTGRTISDNYREIYCPANAVCRRACYQLRDGTTGLYDIIRKGAGYWKFGGTYESAQDQRVGGSFDPNPNRGVIKIV